MTRQEIFDKAVGGILKQGGPAIDHGNCVYRSQDKRKCGAGQLIDDDAYSKSLEGASLSFLPGLAQVPKILEALDKSGVRQDDFLLVKQIQTIHDKIALACPKPTDAQFLVRFQEAAWAFAMGAGLEWTLW